VSTGGRTRRRARAAGQADLFWPTWTGRVAQRVDRALASGLPAVVTDVGGTRDLVDDGVEGFVVMPQNADAIVQHSLAILGDAERRTRMSAAARRRAERFGVGQMVRATQAVYERVLARRAA
jgi:glycosyltransferase involved in cell wall biosynthesis